MEKKVLPLVMDAPPSRWTTLLNALYVGLLGDYTHVKAAPDNILDEDWVNTTTTAEVRENVSPPHSDADTDEEQVGNSEQVPKKKTFKEVLRDKLLSADEKLAEEFSEIESNDNVAVAVRAGELLLTEDKYLNEEVVPVKEEG